MADILAEVLLGSGHLFGCFSVLHEEKIKSQTTRSEKIRVMIDLLRNRSIGEYGMFMKALRNAHHGQVADVLETEGGEKSCHVD